MCSNRSSIWAFSPILAPVDLGEVKMRERELEMSCFSLVLWGWLSVSHLHPDTSSIIIRHTVKQLSQDVGVKVCVRMWARRWVRKEVRNREKTLFLSSRLTGLGHSRDLLHFHSNICTSLSQRLVVRAWTWRDLWPVRQLIPKWFYLLVAVLQCDSETLD